MKMSEFTTKSFLGNAGAAENSYILINYEDNTTQKPVTYKASLQEIGKAIANDQKLYKKTQNGAVTTDVSHGAYVNGTAEVFASTGAVAAAVSGLASTGYVDAAVANAGGNDGFTNDGDIPVYVDASSGDLKWYNWADPSDCTPYNVISTNGKYLVTYDAIEDAFGYFADVSASQITAISGLASTGYVTSAIQTANGDKVTVNDSGKLQYYNAEGSIDAVTIDMISGAVTPSNMELNSDTLSYLLVNGSVDTYYKDEYGTWRNVGCPPVFYNAYNDQLVDIAGEPITIAAVETPYTMSVSNWTFNYMTFIPGTGEAYITDDGLYDYTGILGHPIFFNEDENEIGYYKLENGERVWQTGSPISTVPQNTVFYSTDVSSNISLEDGSGNTLILFRYNQADGTYTPEVPHN